MKEKKDATHAGQQHQEPFQNNKWYLIILHNMKWWAEQNAQHAVSQQETRF